LASGHGEVTLIMVIPEGNVFIENPFAKSIGWFFVLSIGFLFSCLGLHENSKKQEMINTVNLLLK
jgi:hypothetical protein